MVDAWLYAKHRMLHTPFFYPLHKTHHAYHSPTAFAGYAIHTIESVWTFCPVLLACYFPHLIPFMLVFIAFFFAFNCYLHCGYTFAWCEKLFPLLMLNSSAFHNLHHEKCWTHYGEIGSLWDMLLGTSAIYNDGWLKGYLWHAQRHYGMFITRKIN